MTNNEVCKGCLALRYSRGVISCSFSIKDGKVCPCVNCIVKTMCNIGCEEFHDYIYS